MPAVKPDEWTPTRWEWTPTAYDSGQYRVTYVPGLEWKAERINYTDGFIGWFATLEAAQAACTAHREARKEK